MPTQNVRPMSAVNSDSSTDRLAEVAEQLGFIPNVYALLATAPAALDGLCQLNHSFASTGFSPAEREIIALTTSVLNDCNYCIAGHSRMGQETGLSFSDIEAIKQGASLRDPSFEALHQLTRDLILNKGKPNKALLASFEAAGFAREQVFEVLIGIAGKVITNTASKFANLTIDDEFL